MTFDVPLIVGVAAFLVWGAVVIRAVRAHADVTTLALVLIVLGLAGGAALGVSGTQGAYAYGYLLSGVLLVLLWSRAGSVRR